MNDKKHTCGGEHTFEGETLHMRSVQSQRAWPGKAASSPWLSSSALACIAQVSLRVFSTTAPSAPSARARIFAKIFSLSPFSPAHTEAPSVMACAQLAG
eukprot:4449742-Pleurochrysis_carterae.AAC.1